MKNRFFVLLLAVLLLLTACRRGAGTANADMPAPAAAPDEAVPEAPAGTAAPLPAYTMADQDGEAGFYRAVAQADGTARLMYIDYASAREVYVCAAPNCAHDSDACTAFLPRHANVAVWGGTLLLLFDDTNTEPMRLDAANADGTDRHTLYTFDDGVTLSGGEMALGTSSLVLCVSSFRMAEDDTVKFENTLAAISLTDGTCTDLYRTESLGSSDLSLFGVLPAGAVCCNVEVTDGSLRTELCLVPWNGGEARPLFGYDGAGTLACCGPDGLYGLRAAQDGETWSLVRMDGSGAQTVLIPDLAALDGVRPTDLPAGLAASFPAGSIVPFTLEGFSGGTLWLKHLYELCLDEKANMRLRSTCYALDINTGTVTEVTLRQTAGITEGPPPIRRFAGDRLLVSVWGENGEDRPALISAEEYRQSRPDYTWLELVYDDTFLA